MVLRRIGEARQAWDAGGLEAEGALEGLFSDRGEAERS